MKNTLVRAISLILSVMLFCVTVVPVGATSITDLKNQIDEHKSNLNEINTHIDGMEDEQDVLEEEISDLDAELLNMMTAIGILEDGITEKEAEIAVAQADYDKAKADEDAQYAAMVVRIQFMYERGDVSALDLLLESGSFSEMLNKADNIESIYEYDRKLLDEYEAIKVQVEEMKLVLEDEKAGLESQRAEMKEQQAYLDTLLAQKKAASEDYEVQIAKARQEAATYKSKIKEEEKKLAALQAEERRKQSATAAGNIAYNANTAKIITNATGSELGKQIANYACQYIGNPYVMGGTSLTNGADCSGFTYRVYSDFGYSIPRTSYSQRSAGTGVDYSNAQPGDLICYDGHVAMYIGGGYIVHASTAKTGIKVSIATYRPILSVRRIVN